jgi:hypothetical protein
MSCQKRPQPEYVTAIVIVECRNAQDYANAAAWMREVAAIGEILPLSEGVITAYAVRIDPEYVRILHLIEASLRSQFAFGRIAYPFNEETLRSVVDLAADLGCRVIPVEPCEICHKPEPFPADVFVLGEDGTHRRSGSVYCHQCAVEMAAKAPRTVRVGEPEQAALAA